MMLTHGFTGDRPLVVQFASNNAKDFADAVELVAPYVCSIHIQAFYPYAQVL